jgi:hypothetical protein
MIARAVASIRTGNAGEDVSHAAGRLASVLSGF